MTVIRKSILTAVAALPIAVGVVSAASANAAVAHVPASHSIDHEIRFGTLHAPAPAGLPADVRNQINGTSAVVESHVAAAGAAVGMNQAQADRTAAGAVAGAAVGGATGALVTGPGFIVGGAAGAAVGAAVGGAVGYATTPQFVN